MFEDVRNYLRAKIVNGEIKVNYKGSPFWKYIRYFEDERVGRGLSKLAKRWEKKHPGKYFFEGLDLPEGLIKR